MLLVFLGLRCVVFLGFPGCLGADGPKFGPKSSVVPASRTRTGFAFADTWSFRTIADFRKTHLATLRGFFEQVLRLARERGAPRIGRVAIDGSKVKANASKHKAMSYDRMRDQQQQLRDEVTQLLAQAEAADAAEDAEYGADRRGDELQRRESRLNTPDPKAQYNNSPIRSRGS
jgi:hypothetical protein